MPNRAARVIASTVALMLVLLAAPSASAKASDPQCVDGLAAMAKAAGSAGAMMSGDANAMDASVSALKAYTSKAPKAIRADMTKLSKAYAKSVKALKSMHFDPTKAPDAAMLAKLEKATKAMDTKALDAASKRVSAWFAKHCGTTP